MPNSWFIAATVALSSISVVSGCGTTVQTIASNAGGRPAVTGSELMHYNVASADEDNEAIAERIAGYTASDWSANSVHISRVSALKAAKAKSLQQAQPLAYHLQDDEEAGDAPEVRPGGVPTEFFGFFKDRHGAGQSNQSTKYFGLLSAVTPVNGNTLTAPISGAPATDGSGNTYWLTQDGKIFVHHRTDVTPPALLFQITDLSGNPTTDTFPHTNLNISFSDGKTVYACSQSGNLYVFNLATKKTTAIFAMGGASPVIGYTPAPFVDFFNTASGTVNTLYAVTNLGTVYKLTVQLSTGTISSSSTFSLPAAGTGYVNYWPSSPIAFKGQFFVGGWNKSNTSSSFDRGKAYYSNLNTGVTRTFTTNTPFIATPAISLDNNYDTVWAFQPSGNHVTFFDIKSGSSINSQELVVDPTDPSASGNPDPINTSYARPNGLTGGIQNQPFLDEIPGGPFSCYVMNCNALFKVNYSSPTFDPSPNPYDTTPGNGNFSERSTNFSDPTITWFSKTHLGQVNGTTSNTSSGTKYVSNVSTSVYNFNNGFVYAMDNYGDPDTSTSVTINEFNPVASNSGAAPSFVDYTSLVLGGAGASASQIGGPAIAVDYSQSPAQFVFNTQSNTGNTSSPSAALWVAQ